jgi:hypothetical protein
VAGAKTKSSMSVEAEILINDAIEKLMRLRVNSENGKVDAKKLRPVQRILYDALTKMRQPLISGTRLNLPEIKRRGACPNIFHKMIKQHKDARCYQCGNPQ